MTATSPAAPGPYSPHLGDLVFFEAQPNHPAATLIRELDCPHPRSNVAVSHVGIVDDSSAGVAQIAENVGDSKPVTVRWSQVRPSSGAEPRLVGRKLLVLREPVAGRGRQVLDAALEMMADKSQYSYTQLILAGLAAILRQVPCESRQRWHLWETVHVFSRCTRAFEELGHSVPPYFCGTCVAMVDEAQRRACAPLNIIEPPCPDAANARNSREFVVIVADALGDIALGVFNDSPEAVRRRIAHRLEVLQRVLSSDSRDVEDRDRDDDRRPGATREGRRALFGRKAALLLVRELRAFEMVVADLEQKILEDLHRAFAVLDATVDAVWDGLAAPQPGDEVFPPLMSLGLILDQYDTTVVEYQPF